MTRILKCLLAFSLLISFSHKSYSQCFELVWSDEFEYSGLPDPSKWDYDVGGSGWGNNELQYYTKNRIENASVENGTLKINAIKENFSGNNYTSARLVSRNKGEWLYGKIEVSAKLPGGRGSWAGIWMLPTDWYYGGWPASGEIDIMEYVGYQPGTVHATIHTEAFNHSIGTQKGSQKYNSTVENEFHVYAVEWYENRMDFFIDDKFYFRFSKLSSYGFEEWPFDKRFHLILNLAVGGSWGGLQGVDDTAFPMTMEVDYVRVYQKLDELGIIGDSIVCKGQQNLQFKLPAGEDRNLKWTVPEDALIIGKADSSLVQVDWGCSNGSIMCEFTTDCNSYSYEYPVKVQTPEISGNMFFNKNTNTLNYSLPQLAETNYNWIVPEDATILKGQNSNEIELEWGDSPGIIQCEMTSPCGTEVSSKLLYSYGQYPFPDPELQNTIPGSFNAVNYDFGGEGMAYHDNDSGNQGDGPRQDEGVDTEYSGSSYNVGWISSGEWLEYTVDVLEEGFYMIDLEVASQNSSSRGPLKILFNGIEKSNNIGIPYTGSWTKFTNVQSEPVYLTREDTLLKLQFGNGGFNIRDLNFTSLVSDKTLLSGQNDFRLFPNPAFNQITIQLLKETVINEIYIEVIDLAGKVLIAQTQLQTDFKIDVSLLDTGFYFIKIIDQEGNSFSGKFLKN